MSGQAKHLALGFAFLASTLCGIWLGYELGRSHPRPVDPAATEEAQAELAEARAQVRSLAASAAASRAALTEARASQTRVEIRTVTRIVRAQEREAAIVAEPPTEQGAAESMERAAEFERKQEARK